MSAHGYVLALGAAVQYVAVALDKAQGGALSYAELAKGYKPSVADLSRIKPNEGLKTDREATEWLMRAAVDRLRPKYRVDTDDPDKVRLTAETTLADLRYENKRIYPMTVEKFGHLYDPMGGAFVENIRKSLGDLTELRESMSAWGWIPEFPALVDEKGLVLVGHRRLAVAEELGIDPVVKKIPCGEGDEANAKRVKYEIASNIGFRPLSPAERKHIALVLYQDHEWTMERIAESLNVTKMTVSRDLADCNAPLQSSAPKRGRPKGKPALRTPELTKAVEAHVSDGGPVPRAALAKEHGVSRSIVDHEVLRSQGRLEHRCPHCGQPCHCA